MTSAFCLDFMIPYFCQDFKTPSFFLLSQRPTPVLTELLLVPVEPGAAAELFALLIITAQFGQSSGGGSDEILAKLFSAAAAPASVVSWGLATGGEELLLPLAGCTRNCSLRCQLQLIPLMHCAVNVQCTELLKMHLLLQPI